MDGDGNEWKSLMRRQMSSPRRVGLDEGSVPGDCSINGTTKDRTMKTISEGLALGGIGAILCLPAFMASASNTTVSAGVGVTTEVPATQNAAARLPYGA